MKKAHANRVTYPEDWQRRKDMVKERDGYACRLCGVTRSQLRKVGKCLNIDHIVRLADGGTNKLSNLWTLCEDCHKKRPGHSHMSKPRVAKRKPIYRAGGNRYA